MTSHFKLKDQLLRQIINGIRTGRFEFKKGNTLATLAMVMNATHNSIFGSSKDILFDAMSTTRMYVQNTSAATLQAGTTMDLQYLYTSIVPAVHVLIPYYTYFFDFYRISQQLHVLFFFTNFSVYDQGLFQSFVSRINKHYFEKAKTFA